MTKIARLMSGLSEVVLYVVSKLKFTKKEQKLKAYVFKFFYFFLISAFSTACTINASLENIDKETSPSSGNSLPTAPTGISLVDPVSSPSNMTHPTVRVSGVANADTVKIYSDSSCTNLLATATATTNTVDIKLSNLSRGTYNFYSTRTNASGTSACSTATLQYVLNSYSTATKLRFSTQPINTSVYEPMNVMVKVEILDANDLVVTNATDTITLSIGTDPVGNSVLIGTRSVTAQYGVALFPMIKIDEAGTGFTLVAAASGLTSATSSSFDVASGPKYVFRSSGVLATYTATGGESLTISGSVATFSSALTGKRIVLGDAITYDSNGSSTNSVNQIAFITAIISESQFKVKTASGGTPVATSGDLDWKIDRAYSDIYNAESGAENVAISAGLRNFDTWSNGRDIVTNNEVWNIYGTYGSDIGVTIDGWTTGASNYLNFYVGRYDGETLYTSYYHMGGYGGSTARFIDSTNANMIIIQDDYVRFDGFVLLDEPDGSDIAIQVTAAASSDVRILNSRITTSYGASGTGNVAVKVTSGNLKMANCTIFGYDNTNTTLVSLAGGAGAYYYLYNNTIFSGKVGVDVVSGNLIAKNNIVAGVMDGFKGTLHASSSDNSSSYKGDSAGTASITSILPYFASITSSHSYFVGFDLHYRNTSFLFAGRNLWTDSDLPVRQDSRLRVRPILSSLGSYQIEPTHYRSVGFNSSTAVESGTNLLSVNSQSIASFGTFYNTVRVGDILEYYDGTSMQLAVIYHLDSARSKYGVLSTNYDQAKVTAAPTTNWRIYRAHTSLNNAFLKIENSSIDPTLVDFDKGQGGETIPSGHRRVIVPVSDAIHNENVNITGWTASRNQLVLMPNPGFDSAVGVWATSGVFTILGEVTTDSRVTFESIQFEHSGTNSNPLLNLQDSKSEVYRSVFRATGKTNIGDAISLNYTGSNGEYIDSNVIYDFKNTGGTATGIRVVSDNSTTVLRNTIYNVDNGIYFNSYGYVKSNLVQSCTNVITDPIGDSNMYSGNISDLAGEFIGAYDLNSTTVKFIDATGRDFRLDYSEVTQILPGGWSQKYGQPDAFGFPHELSLLGISGAFRGPKKIFRSMGYNKTTAVTSGGGTIGFTIPFSTGIGTFSSALPGNVGVGDVIVFNRAGSGASDTRLTIVRRLSSTQFLFSESNGRVSEITKNVQDTQWAIYRAYSSLSGVNSGSENTGIPVALRDFDDHTAGRPIGAYREQWHVALYADAVDVGAVTFNTWATDSSDFDKYFVRFFTPYKTTEVGTSQRHNGIPSSTGYIRNTGTGRALDFYNNKIASVILDGLQIRTSGLTTSAIEGPGVSASIVVQNSLIYDLGAGYAGTGIALTATSNAKVVNNLFVGHTTGIGMPNAVNVLLMNNTVIANNCFSVADWAYVMAINNVGICGTAGFSVGANVSSTAGSSNNAVTDNTAIGTASFQITQAGNILFNTYSADEDYTNDNFTIKDINSQLYHTGASNFSDPTSFLPKIRTEDDILGNTRGSTWDIGAYQ